MIRVFFDVEFEARLLVERLQPGGQRDNRRVIKSRRCQRPPQQRQITRRAALSARLGDADHHIFRVVFSRLQGFYQIADDDDGGIANFVVGVFQPRFGGIAVGRGEHIHFIAHIQNGANQRRGVKIRELRRENHFVAVFFLIHPHRLSRRVCAFFVPTLLLYRLNHRAQPQPHRAGALNFINADDRVPHAIFGGETVNFIHRDGVRSAAERVQLHHFHIFVLTRPAHGVIIAVGIFPLGEHVRVVQHGVAVNVQRVFGDDIHPKIGEHARHAVIDERVNVIRSPQQQNDQPVVRLGARQNFVPFGADGVFICLLCRQRAFESAIDGFFVDTQSGQIFRHDFFEQFSVAEGDGGYVQRHAEIPFGVDGTANHIGIAGNNRAVETVQRVFKFFLLEHHHRVKNAVNFFVNQIVNVPVRDFGGIADIFRHDCARAARIHFAGGRVGQLHANAAFGEQRVPEGVIFVHVQRARNAERQPHGGGGFGVAVEQQVIFEFGQVGALFHLFAAVRENSLAAVAGIKNTFVRELQFGDGAAVFAAVAVDGVFFVITRAVNRFQPDETRLRVAGIQIFIASGQRRAIRPHQFRNIGAEYGFFQQRFHRFMHGGIAERAALHQNMVAQHIGIGDFQHFVQRIFDDRICQSGGNIVHAGALAQRLFHFRVHKNRAARAQIAGRLRGGRFGGEIRHTVPHRAGKRFDERAAAGRAGFIQFDILNVSVLHINGFHILPADVQNERHIRVESAGGAEVRQRFHHAHIEPEHRVNQIFAVPRDHRAGDVRRVFARPKQVADFCQPVFHCADGVAVVAGIMAEQHPSVHIGQHQFGGGRTGIHTEKNVFAVRVCNIGAGGFVLIAGEFPAFKIFFRFEKRGEPVFAGENVNGGIVEPRNQVGNGGVQRCSVCRQRRAHRRQQFAVFGAENAVIIEFQHIHKRRAQRGQKCQRTAAHQQFGGGVVSARQGGDHLQCHRVKNGRGNIFVRNLAAEQVLHIGFGEHPAAGGDGVHFFVFLRQRVQFRNGNVQQGSHLVDERARAARARTVHPNVGHAFFVKENHFGVFPTDVNQGFHVGVQPLDHLCGRNHFLNERDFVHFADAHPRRAGDLQLQGNVAELRAGFVQRGKQGVDGFRIVAAICRKSQRRVFVQQCQFRCGGTDVNAQLVAWLCHCFSPDRRWMNSKLLWSFYRVRVNMCVN